MVQYLLENTDCGTAGPGQTDSHPMHTTTKASQTVCVKLGNSNRLLNAQGPKTNSESMCNGPEMFLAGLAHAASCDICGLDSAQGPHALYTAHTDMPHDHNKCA